MWNKKAIKAKAELIVNMKKIAKQKKEWTVKEAALARKEAKDNAQRKAM
jgi:hypothetical protein